VRGTRLPMWSLNRVGTLSVRPLPLPGWMPVSVRTSSSVYAPSTPLTREGTRACRPFAGCDISRPPGRALTRRIVRCDTPARDPYRSRRPAGR
jgi:hypothetical protein